MARSRTLAPIFLLVLVTIGHWAPAYAGRPAPDSQQQPNKQGAASAPQQQCGDGLGASMHALIPHLAPAIKDVFKTYNSSGATGVTVFFPTDVMIGGNATLAQWLSTPADGAWAAGAVDEGISAALSTVTIPKAVQNPGTAGAMNNVRGDQVQAAPAGDGSGKMVVTIAQGPTAVSFQCNGQPAVNSCNVEVYSCHTMPQQQQQQLATAPKTSDGFDGANWMAALDDDILLTDTTIPGTHDTMAFRSKHIGFDAFGRTQAMSLDNQLNFGVRALDIRLQQNGEQLLCVHSSMYLQANLGDVLKSVLGFLDKHPTEAVVMSVKQEGATENPQRTFAQLVAQYIKWAVDNDDARMAERFWMSADIPTMQQARGKVVLMKRFWADEGSTSAEDLKVLAGWDLTNNWQEDGERFEVGYQYNHFKTVVEDNYSATRKYKKTLVKSMMDDASRKGNRDLYITFVSIAGLPTTYANSMDYWLSDLVGGSGNYCVMGRDHNPAVGIMFLDFPEMYASLVEQLVQCQSRGFHPKK